MSDTLQDEIRRGLAIPSWDESIDAVQTTVANALSRLDGRVRIQKTGYFNHSFVPDFTLTWPGPAAPSRELFLRLGMSPGALLDDLDTLDTSQPFLLDVGESILDLDGRALTAVADGRDALIADSAAVSALKPRRGSRYTGLLPSTILRGGRGVLGGPEARALADSALAFFEATETHRRKHVQSNANALAKYLSRPAYRRLTNLGHVVWEATGGDPTRYPLQSADSSSTDDDDVQFLLEMGPTGEPPFWRSVGDSLPFDRLVDRESVRTRNLRFLIAANFDRLWAGVVAVRPSKMKMSSDDPQPPVADGDVHGAQRWSIADGTLQYHGTGFTACIATSREHDPDASDGNGSSPRLAELATRLGVIPVESLSATTPDGRSISVKSATPLDILADTTLRDLVDGPSVVESVGVQIGESPVLTCYFADLSASGPEGSLFPLAHLLRAALPILMPLPEDDVAELRWIAAYNASVRTGHRSAEDDLGPW